jgi:rhodanese-related sulfurtransferase
MSSLSQVTVHDVAEKLRERGQGGPSFVLLDVRELPEEKQASLGNEAVLSPLSALAEHGLAALPDVITADKSVEIVVMCHHGVRSAQVTMWLRRQGWSNVFNMTGGINAYAIEIDPAIGQY